MYLLFLIVALVLLSCTNEKPRRISNRARQPCIRIRVRAKPSKQIDTTAAEDIAEAANAFSEYGIALNKRAEYAAKEADKSRRAAADLRRKLNSCALTFLERQTTEKQLAAAERAEVKNNADAMRFYAQAQAQYAKARKMEEKARKSAHI